MQPTGRPGPALLRHHLPVGEHHESRGASRSQYQQPAYVDAPVWQRTLLLVFTSAAEGLPHALEMFLRLSLGGGATGPRHTEYLVDEQRWRQDDDGADQRYLAHGG